MYLQLQLIIIAYMHQEMPVNLFAELPLKATRQPSILTATSHVPTIQPLTVNLHIFLIMLQTWKMWTIFGFATGQRLKFLNALLHQT